VHSDVDSADQPNQSAKDHFIAPLFCLGVIDDVTAAYLPPLLDKLPSSLADGMSSHPKG
jgi:hypothetical protein